MTRVLHTGDTHLGYRQYHTPERRRDFLDAFQRVVDDAVEAEVDAVVHAGDLFHDRRPGLGDLLDTLSVLRDLRAADISFLAIVGNHESTRTVTTADGGSAPQWLDLFETLGLAERLDAAGRVVGDTVFYGLDHVPESRRDDLDYQFTPHDVPHAALVSHGLFTPFAHGTWDAEAVLAASNVDFDAVLLGDNHDPGEKKVDGTWVTYCGSTERASASEREERGYNLVTFEEEVQISRKGIETRPFVFLDVELDETEGPGRVRDRIREHDVTDAVVVVTLDGAGSQVTPAEIERFGEERGALLTRVNDRRDLEDPERAVDVSFADPDDAVRERVRDLGLSQAAHTIDETVREGAVADSNVRETVVERVRDLLDRDEAAFETVPDDEPAPEVSADDDSSGAEAETGTADADGGEGGPGAGAAADGEAGSGAENAGDGEAVADVDDQTATETPEETETPAVDEIPEETKTPDGADADADTEDATGTDEPPADGQVTMEDYL